MRRLQLFLLAFGASITTLLPAADVSLPSAFPGQWNPVGRVAPHAGADSVTLQDGFIASKETWGDCDFSFQARAPEGTAQVQIWAGIRGRDRDSRYVFALRGGENNDVYLARYASDGDDTLLGIAPLDFKPQPGTWYTLRAVVKGNRFQIFVNDEQVPRINVVDVAPVWKEGGVSLGGGWLPMEYRAVKVTQPQDTTVATAVWQAPPIDREARRTQQRAAYQPFTVDKLGPDRTELALDGKWLFSPDQELAVGTQPLAADYDDDKWHVLEVPALWTPCLSWLYAETGFKGADELSSSKGICDKLLLAEQDRLNNLTFDWKQTKSGWYRHYMTFPADIAGKHVEIDFDAIAKISEVWVNGTKVGGHTGMFGEVDCDITPAIHPGKNILAVHVVGVPPSKTPGNQVMGVAVTVEVTAAMLNSLPHGMFEDNASGIWQPVKLVVTSPLAVSDVYIRPKLDGADFDVAVRNGGTAAQHATLSYEIKSTKDDSVLYTSIEGKDLEVPPGGMSSTTISTPKLNPQLWTPVTPNLYRLEVRVSAGDAVVDRKTTEFGFRTFVTDKNRFLLNGKPYWLRGGDHFPSSLRPNDAALAKKFIELAQQGNVRITRSHTVPMTETWLAAADEYGMGVSYEGTWPWLMLKGPPPDEKLLTVWKDEFSSIIRKYRNHPSVLMWTVNNEMKFPAMDKKDPELLKKKWTIVSDMIKTMRQIDPTRPIVADSSYVRKEVQPEYDSLIKPGGFDDGDVDDTHSYPGWYNPSFFHLFKGEMGAKLATPDRPLISQEMSTGYSRNDDGHPVRAYLFNHHTPQPLIGDEAYENRDPSFFLTRQAFMTKELAETFRRADRSDCAGIIHFAYVSWFQDVWNADNIAPFPAYHALQAALQPVLVSVELFGRHFYAGAVVHRRVCVVNDADDFGDLPAGDLTWEVQSDGKTLAQGKAAVSATPYYSNQWIDVDFKMPDSLPSPRVNAQLVLKLETAGKVVSQNSYDIVVATQAWATEGLTAKDKVAVFDPAHKADATLQGLQARQVTSLANLKPGSPEVLIIGDAAAALGDASAAASIKQFVQAGGRVFMLNARNQMPVAYPDQVASYRSTNSGEVATMHIAESPVFDGLEPLDMSWFELGPDKLPNACAGLYTIQPNRDDVVALAEHCDIHGYLKKKKEDLAAASGSPLVQITLGQGTILASEMDLEAAPNDPIARRLIANVISTLQK